MSKTLIFSILFFLFCRITNAQFKAPQVLQFKGHSAGISSLAFSPDGKYLVSGSQDESLKIWDLEKKEVIKTISKFRSAPTSLSFSPDGLWLAVGHYAFIRIYKTHRWKLKSKKEIFPAFVENLAVSPDGKQLAASSWKGKSLITADFPSMGNVRELKETDWTDALSYSADGNYLVTGSHGNAIKMWETSTGSLVNQFQNHDDWVYGCYFLDNGSKIVSAGLDKQIVICDSKTGKVIVRKEGHSDGITYMGKTKEDKWLFTTSLDKTLKIWELPGLVEVFTMRESKDKLITLAVSPDSKWVATGGGDGVIYLIGLK